MKRRRKGLRWDRISQVDESGLKEMAGLLYEEFRRKRQGETYARVKEILTLLAKGGFLLSCFLAPGMARLAPEVLKSQPERDEWQKFDKTCLRRSLKSLEKQGLVEIRKDEEEATVRITKLGEQKVLKYALESFEIVKPLVWDGKWRLIIYDISAKKEYFQQLFRKTIKKLGLYQLQHSVYLTPFACQKQIGFLREYFGIKDEVVYLVVEKLENDKKYKRYFDL